jgi:uncharacterized protein (TIGR03437 family)
LLAGTFGAIAGYGQSACSTPEEDVDIFSPLKFSFNLRGKAPGTCGPEIYLTFTNDGVEMVEYFPCNGTYTRTEAEITTILSTLKSMCGPEWLAQFANGEGVGQSSHAISGAAVALLPLSGQGSQQLVLADFNADGNSDSANISSRGVQVQLMASDGSVISSATYAVGFSTSNPLASSIIAADFNGDGKLDLAVSNFGSPGVNSGGIAILLGAGDGTFGAPIAVAAGTNPLSMAAADFNGDGKLDIAAANQWSATSTTTFEGPGAISLLLGNGDGTFQAPVTYSAGEDHLGLPDSLVALDLNGDGHPDLAVANRNDNSISTLINSGGQFKPALVTPLPVDVQYLAFSDFNHDGKLDLAAASSHSSALVMLAGKGDGSFQAPAFYAIGNRPGSLGVAPLQDGNTLLVSADGLTGNPWITIVSPQGVPGAPALTLLGGSPTGVAAADLNGDGQPDAVVVGGSGVSVVLSKGGAYQAPVKYSLTDSSPQAVAIGDLNKDGKPDIVVANIEGSVSVLLGNGDGTLRSPSSAAVDQNASSIALGDFNGDGKLDAAVAAYGSDEGTQGSITVLSGNGNGTFQSPLTLTVTGFHLEAVATADLNGDGMLDIAAVGVGTSRQTATLAVFLGQTGGKFQPARTFPIQASGVTEGGIAIGDLNGDGRLDIVAFTYGQKIDVLLGDGLGGFHEAATLPTSLAANNAALALADINGDGKLDIVTTGTFFAGNGDGTFQTEQQFLAASLPTSVAIVKIGATTGMISVGQAGTMAATALLTPLASPLTIGANVSAASPTIKLLTPASIATAFGTDLATETAGASSATLPTTLGKTTVTITDSAGAQLPAPLFYVSSGQVNYEVPAATAIGDAQVTIVNGNGDAGSAGIQIAKVAPAVFTLNAAGLAAADVITVAADGSKELGNVYTVGASGVQPLPVNLNAGPVYLSIFATGIRNAQSVTATVAGQSVPVLFWGAQGVFAGLDQVNIGPLPVSLKGRGSINIGLSADSQSANTVSLTIQ